MSTVNQPPNPAFDPPAKPKFDLSQRKSTLQQTQAVLAQIRAPEVLR